MKKVIIFFSLLFFLKLSALSQDVEVGYNTTDIGVEFNHYTGGNIFNLHLAFNAKLHHSIILRAGYNSINEQYTSSLNNETGGGVTAGIGYRYFFAYRPHLFFIGAKIDYSYLNIKPGGIISTGDYKTSSFFTGAETGFKFLINDQVFITPAVGLGVVNATGSKAGPTRTGFTVLPGISAGVQF